MDDLDGPSACTSAARSPAAGHQRSSPRQDNSSGSSKGTREKAAAQAWRSGKPSPWSPPLLPAAPVQVARAQQEAAGILAEARAQALSQARRGASEGSELVQASMRSLGLAEGPEVEQPAAVMKRCAGCTRGQRAGAAAQGGGLLAALMREQLGLRGLLFGGWARGGGSQADQRAGGVLPKPCLRQGLRSKFSLHARVKDQRCPASSIQQHQGRLFHPNPLTHPPTTTPTPFHPNPPLPPPKHMQRAWRSRGRLLWPRLLPHRGPAGQRRR